MCSTMIRRRYPNERRPVVKRCVSTLFLALLGFAAAPAALPATGPGVPVAEAAADPPATAPPDDPVIQWNRFLLGIQATPGDQPSTVHPTHELALMHAAIYDAVVSIDRSASPYLTHVHGPHSASLAGA